MITATLTRPPLPKRHFPCLMESTFTANYIVYMTAPGRGVVLNQGSGERPAGFVGDWCLDSFRPFAGTLELSNA